MEIQTFIEKYYPNYSSCNKIAQLNDLWLAEEEGQNFTQSVFFKKLEPSRKKSHIDSLNSLKEAIEELENELIRKAIEHFTG